MKKRIISACLWLAKRCGWREFSQDIKIPSPVFYSNFTPVYFSLTFNPRFRDLAPQNYESAEDYRARKEAMDKRFFIRDTAEKIARIIEKHNLVEKHESDDSPFGEYDLRVEVAFKMLVDVKEGGLEV